MTIATANVANTNTFYYWQTVTNQLAGAMSTAVITTTANGTTAQTAGNAAISGTLSANIYVSNTSVVNTSMFVGNATVNVSSNSSSITLANSTANLIIIVPTAVQISNGQYFLNANGTYSLVTSLMISNTVTTTGTSTQTLDQWPLATYRSAEYQVNVNDNNANSHYGGKLMVIHDTSVSYMTEFAVLTSNGSVGTFAASLAGANVVIQFTPISTNTTVRYTRVVL